MCSSDLSDLYMHMRHHSAHAAYHMVVVGLARNGSQRFRQPVTCNHIDPYAENELLHCRRDGGSGRREESSALQPQSKQIVEEAHGYAVERVNRARGEVARFQAILKEYQGSEQVTRQRMFLETMEEILPKTERLYITH